MLVGQMHCLDVLLFGRRFWWGHLFTDAQAFGQPSRGQDLLTGRLESFQCVCLVALLQQTDEFTVVCCCTQFCFCHK